MFHRALKESLGWIRGSYLFRQMIVTITKGIRKNASLLKVMRTPSIC